jgi:ribonuclease HII
VKRNPSTPASDRLAFERDLWSQNQAPIAGVDEAGRGPLAGPVVAAAVILPAEWSSGIPSEYESLNDSKQLSEAARESFFTRITTDARIQFAIAMTEPDVIDRINILAATHRAMNEALRSLVTAPVHVLVDGNRVPSLAFPQTPLVKGDSRSYSIAAASVLAKVTRDRLMVAADSRFPGYGFAKHKGYPTAEHLDALARKGPCPLHRRSFAPLRTPEPDLFSR